MKSDPSAAPGSLARTVARALARRLAASEMAWGLLPDFLRRRTYLQVQRNVVLAQSFARRRDRLFAARTVRRGPFAGLRYPVSEEFGSAYYPKLLGSYEAELHDRLGTFVERQPPLVVDIGCAGGYYLAGLGRLLPQAKLMGYDLDAPALAACRALALANGLPAERLELAGAVTLDSLRTLLPQRSLVICDCEGYETEIFTPATLALWAQSDLIIECHDFLRAGITGSLHGLLAATHDVETIPTGEATDKFVFLDGPDFAQFSRAEKLALVAEGRPAAMSWVVALARSPG